MIGDRLNMGLIQEQVRNRLLCLLEKCNKIYSLYSGTLITPPDITNVIFMSGSQLKLINLIAENVYRLILLQFDNNFLILHILKKLNREEKDNKSRSVSSIANEHLLLLRNGIIILKGIITEISFIIDTVQLPTRKFYDSIDFPTAMSLNEKEQIILNSGELFAESKYICNCIDKNFNDVEPVFSKKAKVISFYMMKDMEIRVCKQFVARLSHMLTTKAFNKAEITTNYKMIKEQVEQELLNCIDTEKPNAYIEDMIAGVPFKLSSARDSQLFASVLREFPVREDVNPTLRGGGGLGEASGTGGATLR
ncbi:Vacuolar protein sorting-associated protein 33A [Atta colombica]|uniref:Vacuolar protein sorting-associated protein 33A n=1 Tax=Atta colombica TaxID=520822 RepID=A0A195BML8_9HYME|nr:Vacuolar protein sorting-associated protein 33A [Atta colombica]